MGFPLGDTLWPYSLPLTLCWAHRPCAFPKHSTRGQGCAFSRLPSKRASLILGASAQSPLWASQRGVRPAGTLARAKSPKGLGKGATSLWRLSGRKGSAGNRCEPSLRGHHPWTWLPLALNLDFLRCKEQCPALSSGDASRALASSPPWSRPSCQGSCPVLSIPWGTAASVSVPPTRGEPGGLLRWPSGVVLLARWEAGSASLFCWGWSALS